MREVSQLFVTTLRNDPEYRGLAGVTRDDPRVYIYYNGSATIDPTRGKKGYITYAETTLPERTSAVGGPVYSVAIWADTFDTAEAIADRVDALFNCEGELERPLVGPDGTCYQPIRIGRHWAAQENTKFAGINIQLRFGLSYVTRCTPSTDVVLETGAFAGHPSEPLTTDIGEPIVVTLP